MPAANYDHKRVHQGRCDDNGVILRAGLFTRDIEKQINKFIILDDLTNSN